MSSILEAHKKTSYFSLVIIFLKQLATCLLVHTIFINIFDCLRRFILVLGGFNYPRKVIRGYCAALLIRKGGKREQQIKYIVDNS